jgi:hypothetical protein
MGNVHHIAVREEVSSWAVMQEDENNSTFPSSVSLFHKEQSGEERAHVYASSLCGQFSFKTYIMSQFTDEPYVFTVRSLDASTGAVLEEHREDCN